MNVIAAHRITLAHHIKDGMDVRKDTLCRGPVARGQNIEVITTADPPGPCGADDERILAHHLPHFDRRRYVARRWRASRPRLLGTVKR